MYFTKPSFKNEKKKQLEACSKCGCANKYSIEYEDGWECGNCGNIFDKEMNTDNEIS